MGKEQEKILSALNRLLHPIKQRIGLMIAKGLLEAVKDSTDIQLIKVSILDGEVQDDVERIQDYGFTSNPPADSEVILACVGGAKDHPVALKVGSSTFRLKNLAEGEVAVFSKFGNKVVLKADGSIEVDGGKLKLNCNLEVDGDISATGKVDATGDITSSANVNGLEVTAVNKTIHLSIHTHVCASPGSPSGPPVG